MGPVWDLFKAALGLTVEVTRDMVTAYLKFLQTLAKWSIIVALILSPLPITGSLLHFSWMSGLYLAVIGLVICIWLIAAFPVVMLVRYAYEDIKSIKKTAQLIGGILFWILLLSIYFYLVPVWNYPAAIPLVFIMSAILAVGFMRFGVGINPRLAIGVVLTILCLITISFYLPTSRSAANTFVGWLDGQVAGFITTPLHPAPQIPKPIGYDHISIERIQFFDVVTSEPRIWCYKLEDGGYELFDGPGYHPHYKEKLQPITSDIVAQIKTKLKAEAERIAQTRVPERTNYDYIWIEKMVFFDPVTAEPRVWYYKRDDGRVELFDGPGYHPQYKVKLEAITPEIVAQIKTQLKADADRISQEEQRRKEEAERIARSPQAPKKLRPVSIEDVVFFDPLTAEPRVWYYKGNDGRFELFDGPGYHAQYKVKLELVTPDIVAQIESQLKADAEKMAQEQQGRREELEKIAADANRPKGSRLPKPPLIKPEDTQGRVEQQKDQVLQPQERVIKSEETEGKIAKPKN